MPKQRHTKPARPATRKPVAKAKAKARPTAKPAKPAKATASKPAARHPVPSVKKAPKRGQAGAQRLTLAPLGPSPHDVAVDVFERGFQALQQRQFGRAAESFVQVINAYPDEKELQERARVYLSICERQKDGQGATPRSLEERINAATVAINRGAFSEGLSLLRQLEPQHRENDHIQYMLCVAYTVLGDLDQALGHLKDAIGLNPENRYLASQDADLETLRQDSRFVVVLETPPSPKTAGSLAGARAAAKRR